MVISVSVHLASNSVITGSTVTPFVLVAVCLTVQDLTGGDGRVAFAAVGMVGAALCEK